ncbi:sugar kinase [Leifsonia sp. L25]|uniref:sugar kinase n=1 Tax=Leifsonia sp. L25 TaxID=3423957 RepID=UPI003D69E759
MTGHVLTFGETMGLFRAAEIGGLADVDTARIGTGGADSNVAIGLSRLGVPAVWVGRVGADGIGRRVVRDILGQGVDARAIVDPGHPTGLMIKEKRTPHTTRVWFYRSGSAGSGLQPTDVDEELIETAAMVHVTGITASISASGWETVRRVLAVARARGVPVSFDVNHRTALWPTGDPAPLYREIAASADVVFAGDDEAALCSAGPQATPLRWSRGCAGSDPRRLSSSAARWGAPPPTADRSSSIRRSRCPWSTRSVPVTRSSPASWRPVCAGTHYPTPSRSPLLRGPSPAWAWATGRACRGPTSWRCLAARIRCRADPLGKHNTYAL